MGGSKWARSWKSNLIMGKNFKLIYCEKASKIWKKSSNFSATSNKIIFADFSEYLLYMNFTNLLTEWFANLVSPKPDSYDK